MTTPIHNCSYFNGSVLKNGPNGVQALKHFVMGNGLVLGMFQGNRGDRADIDFVVKFLQPGERSRLRTPSHLHWVVDLLLKMETHKPQVRELVRYYRDFYNEAPVFSTVRERNEYVLVTPSVVGQRFGDLTHHGTYPIDYIAHLLELFTLCEKLSPRPLQTKMFIKLLQTLHEYGEGTRDFYQVLSAASPGYLR